MRTEVPILERCCFCLPLRHGLIAWGYLKLLFPTLVLIYSILQIINQVATMMHFGNHDLISYTILFTVVAALAILDLALHVLFIVGAYKKDTTFLRVYYFYAITLLVVTLLLDFACVGYTINYSFHPYIGFYYDLLVFALTTMFTNLVIQGYVIILVRSEIIKLDNIRSFKFVNNAAEAECELQIEEEIKDKTDTEQEENMCKNVMCSRKCGVYAVL